MPPLVAACFDFRGVIVNHENDRGLIPGIENLLRDLKARGTSLVVISSFGPEFVRARLGQLGALFDGRIYCASEEGKLQVILQHARGCDIADLSQVAFIDDKPENLLPAAKSAVKVIGYLGSGKYKANAPSACQANGIPFASTIAELRLLLGLSPK